VAENYILYGKGVFTTVCISGGAGLFWDKHWKRLLSNAKKLDIDISQYSYQSVLDKLHKITITERIDTGRARISFLDSNPSRLWPSVESPGEVTKLLIEATDRLVRETDHKITTSSFPVNSRSPLVGVKSCNYLEPIMSLDEAKARGFHEAIRLNECGFVTSACMANVFWVKGGELFTPGLAMGCLAGTTRDFVFENIDCREVEVGIEALKDADAIFLTSAGIGVVQVAEFEGRRLEKVDHPILHLLPY